MYCQLDGIANSVGSTHISDGIYYMCTIRCQANWLQDSKNHLCWFEHLHKQSPCGIMKRYHLRFSECLKEVDEEDVDGGYKWHGRFGLQL